MGIYQKIKKKIRSNLAVIIVCWLIFVCVVIYWLNHIFVLIRPGEAGVLYKPLAGGTVTTRVYGEGLHIVNPINTMFIYNVRYQQTPHEFDVLTTNGLKVNLLISIRYRPEYNLLGILHQRVGPEYVDIVVIPEIENVLRVLIGKLDAEQVYKTEKAIIEKSLSEAVEQIAQRFVKVDDVIIKRIQLPPDVAQVIQDKVKQYHLADAYKFKLEKEKQELERKRIEADGLKIFNKALSEKVLRWMGIQATLSLAEGDNARTVIIGAGKYGFPIIGNVPLAPIPTESESETIEIPSVQGSETVEGPDEAVTTETETETESGIIEIPPAQNSETLTLNP